MVLSLGLSGAIYVIGTGRWIPVYAFLIQFHQRVLWVGYVILFVPVLLAVFLRAWGVKDVPQVEKTPELAGGKLEPLAQRIQHAQRNEYDQAILTNELSELATRVIALNRGIDLAAARRLCRSGKWKEDEVVLDLVAHHRMPDEPPGSRFVMRFERVLETIEHMLKGGRDIGSRPSR